MSRLGRSSLLATAQVKRSAAGEHPKSIKRARCASVVDRHETESMTDTNAQKRPNFSALANPGPNGVNKIAPSLAGPKPGAAKKIVIKNFKSMS